MSLMTVRRKRAGRNWRYFSNPSVKYLVLTKVVTVGLEQVDEFERSYITLGPIALSLMDMCR